MTNRHRYPSPAAPARMGPLCSPLLALLCLLLMAWPGGATAHAASATPAATPVKLAFNGKVVKVNLSGFEPDFDPIDRIVIAATLHDSRPRGQALPDTMVVLSTYLENFQPDTTPVLPDLLHPNQTATSLGGFMQGKAALVNRGGRTSFSGGVLAEVFLDNAAHVILDVDRTGASASAPSLRLEGTFTLYKDLSVHGEMHSVRPLAPAESAALRVPAGALPSWQTVIGGMAVRFPQMMGTGGNSSTGAPGGAGSTGSSGSGGAKPSSPQTSATAVAKAFHPAAAAAAAAPSAPHRRAAQSAPTPTPALAAGAILLAACILLAAIMWRRRALTRRRAA